MQSNWLRSVPILPLLLLLLVPAVCEEAPKCTIKYGAGFLQFPSCAQYCIACEDTNLSFGHNCYYPSGQCCKVDIVGSSAVKYVWQCVSKSCTQDEAQAAVNLWVSDCAQLGLDAPVSLLPNDLKADGMTTVSRSRATTLATAKQPSPASASASTSASAKVSESASTQGNTAQATSTSGPAEAKDKTGIWIAIAIVSFLAILATVLAIIYRSRIRQVLQHRTRTSRESKESNKVMEQSLQSVFKSETRNVLEITATESPDPSQPPADRTGFRVAIICALTLEADAVTLLFDRFWDEEGDRYGRADGDTNHYTTGRIGNHHVVLVVLPGMGTNNAAAATVSLRTSFTNIRLAILVGVCGGVPRIGGHSAFLGDVIVSKTIVQYDYGRQYPGHFAVKVRVEDSLKQTNKDIASLFAMSKTEQRRAILQAEASGHLKSLQEAAQRKRRRANYGFPGQETDILYEPNYTHRHQRGCTVCAREPGIFCEPATKISCDEAGCDASHKVTRERRENAVGSSEAFSPEIFIGTIGSGNTVMKSGRDRDRIAAEHDLIAFEMEGAGAFDEIPCIVVKGVCDYADSHKNKSWQDFAAATAASVAKAILGRYPVQDGDRRYDSKRQS